MLIFFHLKDQHSPDVTAPASDLFSMRSLSTIILGFRSTTFNLPLPFDFGASSARQLPVVALLRDEAALVPDGLHSSLRKQRSQFSFFF